MIRNYLKIAIRNIQRYPSYSFINVSGLALGIACGILIFSFIKYHLSFDDFHANEDRIYRVVTEMHRDEVSYRPNVPAPFGKVFRDDYTFGEKVARICTFNNNIISLEGSREAIKFKEKEAAFVETEFFEIFNYPLVSGDINYLLKEPHTAIITERIAHKYFGDESPVNKTFRFDNKVDFKITGILKNLPENSDRRTEIYLSYATLKEYNEWMGSDDSWGGMAGQMECFVKLRQGVTVSEVEKVLPAYVKKYRPTNKNVHHYKLQPLNDMHFNARYGGIMEKKNLWILSLIGFFLIVTACVNFINLATAQAIHRSKEVGVRKVLGSMKAQLFWQFIMETGVITTAATIIALSFALAVVPYLNGWFDSQIAINLFSDWQLLLFIPLLVIVVTFFSGSYPGLILSGFKPVLALKGKLNSQQVGGFNIRRVLIVTQFAISQVLIIGLIVIIYQMHYAKQSDMGFNKDAVIMIPVGSNDSKMNALKNEFLTIQGVEKLSLCFEPPASRGSWGTSVQYEGRQEPEDFAFSYKGGDDQYLSTFDLKLVAGRNLVISDTVQEFIVNEMMVKKLGLKSPEEIIGKRMSANGDKWKGSVVGVIKDFHDKSFHEEIKPVLIASDKDEYSYYAVKVNMRNIQKTLSSLDKFWSQMYPEQIYEYEFLDKQIEGFYKTEDTMLKLIQTFSSIAIFIGCLGLYGLVSFMSIQRTKEIGIRKVLGSSVSQILWIFGKEFLVLIGIAFLMAAPAGWWLMNEWLQNFKYSVHIDAWIFLVTITITSVVALVTVGYQSFRAALRNPAKSLRAD